MGLPGDLRLQSYNWSWSERVAQVGYHITLDNGIGINPHYLLVVGNISDQDKANIIGKTDH